MALRWAEDRKLRILDFDIENRPLAYWYPGETTAEVTAIAASWVGKSHVDCWLLGHVEPFDMLSEFWELFEQSDMVTGHYIRAHDLPLLTGAMIEHGLPPLSRKLTQDTKLDLVKKKDLSASQEDLSSMFGLSRPKHHLSNPDWRDMNRLTFTGLETTYKRVTSDVRQHKTLRKRLIEAGALKAPRVWQP